MIPFHTGGTEINFWMIFLGIAFAESGDPRYIEELDDVMHTLPHQKKRQLFFWPNFLDSYLVNLNVQ